MHALQFKGSALARLALRLLGWQLMFEGLPAPRGVIIVYPHTSNWDFLFGILTKWAIGMPLQFWVKETLLRGWFGRTAGWFLRRWGAVAVDRQSSTGVTQNTVAQMQSSSYFWLALAPEGTRKYQDHWKSGFYNVANTAHVPLGLAFIDYGTKRVGVTTFIDLTGDPKADLATIERYYQNVKAAKPQNAAPVRFRG